MLESVKNKQNAASNTLELLQHTLGLCHPCCAAADRVMQQIAQILSPRQLHRCVTAAAQECSCTGASYKDTHEQSG